MYVNTFPNVTGPRAVSPGHAVDPVWSPDGQTIYFRDRTAFFAVDVSTEPEFTTSAPRKLFERPGYLTRGKDFFRNWDLHPNGLRFVMVAPAAAQLSAPKDVQIVVNFFEELKAKVGN